MRRRKRMIAGVFALVALTFASAETVLASMCAPGMDMQAMGMQTADVAAPQAPADDRMAAFHDHRDDGDNERHCPFGSAVAAQACAGVASLPTHAVTEIPPSLEGVVDVFVEQTQHDLLFGNALFRPPRA